MLIMLRIELSAIKVFPRVDIFCEIEYDISQSKTGIRLLRLPGNGEDLTALMKNVTRQCLLPQGRTLFC